MDTNLYPVPTSADVLAILDRIVRRIRVGSPTRYATIAGRAWRRTGSVGPATSLVHGDDARVLEPRRDQGLAQESDLADGPSRQELLEGDVAAELAIVAAGDAARPPRPCSARI